MVRRVLEYSAISSSSSSSQGEDSDQDAGALSIIYENNNDDDDDDDSNNRSGGSSVVGAAMNLFNSTIGAGVIGLGGAIAGSGGIISIVMMTVFAVMAKISLDMVIVLAVETGSQNSSYEDLGTMAFGSWGRTAVALFKGMFAFGCLVAYVVIVKDNFSSAVQHLLLGLGGGSNNTNNNNNNNNEGDEGSVPSTILMNENVMALALCTAVMLPLSLLREMGPLARFSTVKVITVFLIGLILIALYFKLEDHDGDDKNNSLNEHWIRIQPDIFPNLGTFVFLYVAQHTSHLVYQSLRPELRNIKSWKKVSSLSMALSTLISFVVGFSAYMTFWSETSSNLFLLYPPSPAVDFARILLCVMVLLTYPPPFFSTRQVIIMSLPLKRKEATEDLATEASAENVSLLQTSESHQFSSEESPWLLPGKSDQLRQPYHGILTVVLWAITVILALSAPSLGDVLSLAGSISGTMIAFVLPGLFYFRLHGYSHSAFALLVGGGVIGCIGTYFSLVHAIWGGGE